MQILDFIRLWRELRHTDDPEKRRRIMLDLGCLSVLVVVGLTVSIYFFVQWVVAHLATDGY